MKRYHSLMLMAGLVIVAQLACNFPGMSNADESIAATLTLMARQTLVVELEAQQTALAPTLTPNPSLTPLPATATEQPRLIDQASTYLQCQKTDMPGEGDFFLPGVDWKGVRTNADILQNWPPGLGQEYVEQTGRVEGGWIWFERGLALKQLPLYIGCDVVRYTTAHGAKRAVTDYNTAAAFPDENTLVDTSVAVGDASVVTHEKYVDNGVTYYLYRIEFSYLNFLVVVSGEDTVDDMHLDVLQQVAQTMLAKLEAAPRE